MSIYNPKDDDLMEIEYDARHGGPYDRGSADAWYGRPFRPHYFVGATYQSAEVIIDDEFSPEFEAYCAGYEDTPFGQKDWD